MSLEEDQAIKILQTALLTHLLYTPCDIVCHNTTGYIPPLVTSDLEHGCLWLPQLVKGGLARGHLYDGAAQGPDVHLKAVSLLAEDLGGDVVGRPTQRLLPLAVKLDARGQSKVP